LLALAGIRCSAKARILVNGMTEVFPQENETSY
jgi:hypothetical protein